MCLDLDSKWVKSLVNLKPALYSMWAWCVFPYEALMYKLVSGRAVPGCPTKAYAILLLCDLNLLLSHSAAGS